jgi:hypothetical protein
MQIVIIMGIFLMIFAAPSRAEDGVDVCRKIVANSARLICFDSLFPSIKSETTSTIPTMTMPDFLTDYRDLVGQKVVVEAYLLQTGNMIFVGADWPPILNYAIVSVDGLARASRRKINSECSSVTGPACKVEIKGIVLDEPAFPSLRANEINFH